MKTISIFMMTMGLVWDILLVWIIFVMTGIAAPSSIFYTGAYFLGQFAGPLALIVGSTLTLARSNVRFGSILVILGCLILTLFVLYACISSLRIEPLQVKPPYLIYLMLLIITIFADVSAFRLYSLAMSELTK